MYGSSVFFGGMKDGSGSSRLCTLLKLNKANGDLEFFYSYKNDLNELLASSDLGNYGTIDLNGNVLLQLVIDTSTTKSIILHKISGTDGSPLAGTSFTKSNQRLYTSPKSLTFRTTTEKYLMYIHVVEAGEHCLVYLQQNLNILRVKYIGGKTVDLNLPLF